MTITTDADRVLHTANGVTTVFSTAPIEKIDEENVEVSLIDPAGTEDPQAIGTDYVLTPAWAASTRTLNPVTTATSRPGAASASVTPATSSPGAA